MAVNAEERRPLDYHALFEVAPSPNLIVRAEPPFIIVAANDAYLAATMTTREQIVGRGIFEVFPDNPNDPEASGVRRVRESIEHVIAHRQPHTMAVQRYDVPRPNGNGFEEKYWSPIHTPLVGEDGKVAYVIQRPEDVTEFVTLKARAGEQDRREAELRGLAEQMEAEVFLRAQELARANAELRRQVEERARAETALAREQDFLKAVLDNAEDGIVACDGDGTLRFFNRAAREFHGMAEQPLPPEQWAKQYDLYLPDGQTRMTKEQVPLFRALADGKVVDAEMVIAVKGHPPRLLTANGRAITDSDGRKLGAVVVMHDLTARRQAEDQRGQTVRVEAERNVLAEVFQRSPSFMVVLRGPQHMFELVNDRYYQLVGHRDLLGKPVRTALPEVEGQGFFELLDRVYQTGEAFVGRDMRLMIQREAGEALEERVVDFVYQPLRAADGSISGVFAQGIDLTEHKQAEAALRESEERYRSLFTSIDQGFCVIEVIFDEDARPLDYRFVEANPAFERQTGLANALGRTARELVPTLEDRWFEMYGRVASTGEALRFEEPSDPMGRWFDVFAFRVGDPVERRVAILFKDVTASKQIEAALRESERRFRDMADTAPAIIWVTERDGSCSFLSRGWYDLTGQTEESGLGFGWVDAAHPDDRPAAREAFVAANAAQQPYAVDFRVRRADGRYVWVIDAARPRFGSDGDYLGMIGSVIDITDRKEAEKEREALLASEQAARAEAERAGRMKDEFLATLSHELRTPLSAILGWSQILGRGTARPETLAEGLRTIERNARVQTQIIEDLLDMSRIISGKVALDARPIDAGDVVRAAIETVRPTAAAKAIDIRFGAAPAERFPAIGDFNRLQQVFWNLLTNAIKFTPRGGSVTITVGQRHSMWQVDVIDTGEGMGPEFLPYVFDRFRQADASTTRRHGGLGLGLSIVKQLVELHGGLIRARSDGVGRGSTFTVSLPVRILHGAARSDVAVSDALGRITPEPFPQHALSVHETGAWDPALCDAVRGRRAVIVDDEPDARALLKQLLGDCGIDVIVTATADEALAAIQRDRPDVLVSDIGMPIVDGYELIARVRALPADSGGRTPAIALTAYARTEDRMRAVRAGYQTHVPKPVEPAELITMIASVMR